MEREWLVYADARAVSWRRPEYLVGDVKSYWVEEGEAGPADIYERAESLYSHSYQLKEWLPFFCSPPELETASSFIVAISWSLFHR